MDASGAAAAVLGRTLPNRPQLGAPPDLTALPAGGSFAPRCAYASAQCRSERPLVLAAGSQTLACWHPLAAAARA